MEQEYLHTTLQTDNLESLDIFSIIGKMEVALEYFTLHKEYKHLIPFLKTYLIITRTVAQKNLEDNEYYDDANALDKLDVYFASLYFKPLLSYLKEGKKTTPWQTYFIYCEEHNKPFVHMLLGINAHINSDLPQTLVDKSYTYEDDFTKINDILEEKIPEVFRFLAFESFDLLGIGGLITLPFIINQFKSIIVKWRADAWNNAKKLKEQPELIDELHKQTEKVANKLIEIFTAFHVATHTIQFFKELYAIEVKL